MHRRKTDDAKNYISDVAESTLVDEGVDGSKIKTLANRAKMRHSNILCHCGSIEGVHSSLIVSILDKLGLELKEILNVMIGRELEEIVASTSLLSDRVFDLFSKPEAVTPFAWKFSTHPDNPVKEMEASVENFIGLVAKRLSDAGLKEEAERENILDMIHLVLATAFGSYVMKTHISKKQPEAQTQKNLQVFINESVISISGLKDVQCQS